MKFSSNHFSNNVSKIIAALLLGLLFFIAEQLGINLSFLSAPPSKEIPNISQTSLDKTIKKTSLKIGPVDGDSFKLGNGEVRLFGIDAPEFKQNCQDATGKIYACGKESAKFLKSLLLSGSLDCKLVEQDRYGRDVSKCFVGELELNAAMVQAGWAIAYKKFGLDYAEAETEAKQNRRGIWQGDFQNPETWRKENN